VVPKNPDRGYGKEGVWISLLYFDRVGKGDQKFSNLRDIGWQTGWIVFLSHEGGRIGCLQHREVRSRRHELWQTMTGRPRRTASRRNSGDYRGIEESRKATVAMPRWAVALPQIGLASSSFAADGTGEQYEAPLIGRVKVRHGVVEEHRG
jgi:hypothetical protein